MASGIATKRASAGLVNEAIDIAFEHRKNTGSFSGVEGVLEAALLANAIERFEPKIRAMFGRAGVALPDGPLTAAGLAEVVGGVLGVELSDLSVESVKTAVETKLSEALSADLGVSLSGVLSGSIKQAIEDEVIKAIKDGRAMGLLSRAKVLAARRYAAFKKEGYAEKEDRKRVMNRLWQKRYRRRNKLVWD